MTVFCSSKFFQKFYGWYSVGIIWDILLSTVFLLCMETESDFLNFLFSLASFSD